MITLINRLRRRTSDTDPEGGSIAMLLLVTIVGVVLSATLMPIIIAQSQTTRFDTTRTDSLNAAQTGVQVVMGQIRNAVDADGTPDARPAAVRPDLGLVGTSTGGTANYWTQIIYYSADPIANPTAAPMVCAAGYGPYDTTLHVRTPHYACLISTGVVVGTPNSQTSSSCSSAVTSFGSGGSRGTSHGRTIVTTYVFNTDDTNYAGGTIRIFPSGTSQYCMDAGSGSPSALTPVLLEECSTSVPPSAQQTWAYRCDLSIQLVSSVTLSVLSSNSTTCSSTCRGTSADARPRQPSDCASTPTPRTRLVTRCTSTPVPRLGNAGPDQQWSIDDNSHLEAANSTGTDLSRRQVCASTSAARRPTPRSRSSPAPGARSDPNQTWVPSPTAGAGMAGAANKQLVNFKLFGNCLDVTGQHVSTPILIAYTCKQNPDPTKVTWNQKFTASPSLASDSTAKPTTVEWITTYNGSNYCVRVRRPMAAMLLSRCAPAPFPTAPSPYLWKVYRLKQSDGVSALTYDQRYTIVGLVELHLVPGSRLDVGSVSRPVPEDRDRHLRRLHRTEVECRRQHRPLGAAEHPRAVTHRVAAPNRQSDRAANLASLTGLRFVAAACVVTCHFMQVGIIPNELSVRHALDDGRTAVVLFFVLSGFILTRQYARISPGRPPCLLRRTVRPHLSGRAARISPWPASACRTRRPRTPAS